MRLLLHPSHSDGIDDVPVLEAVFRDAPVKWVAKLALQGLEVSVATVVGLLVRRHVIHHHLKLEKRAFFKKNFFCCDAVLTKRTDCTVPLMKKMVKSKIPR